MRVCFFSARRYDRESFDEVNAGRHELRYYDTRLMEETAAFASGSEAICAFVNDDLSAPVLERLAEAGVGLVALRSAGFNHVDLPAAKRLGLAVSRVPAYSPHAVAEHAVMLLLALSRHICRAQARIRDGNFALDGLLGFGLHGRTVGVVGTGQIGTVFCRIMAGFGMRILCHDPFPNDEVTALGARYVELPELFAESDVIALHVPLTEETRHLIDADALATMKPGVVLINTSRGPLIDTPAVIEALKARRLGGLAIDVYEEEAALFFEDHSADIPTDDVFARLTTFPNVLVTGHQGFLTEEALRAIAETTVTALDAFAAGEPLAHPVG